MSTHPAPIATQIHFVVEFHSTFRVGAAYPNDGIDLTYDEDEPLPADHLKGIMRAEAVKLATVLKLPAGLVDQTFGTPSAESAWSWFSAEAEWERPFLRHRVAIDAASHAARQDHLVAATSTVPVRVGDGDGGATHRRATFTVERVLNADDTAEAVAPEAALIRLAGRSIHHLGGWRRRGYGWVGVTVETDSSADPGGSVTADLDALTAADRQVL
jgi:hypothetical protein